MHLTNVPPGPHPLQHENKHANLLPCALQPVPMIVVPFVLAHPLLHEVLVEVGELLDGDHDVALPRKVEVAHGLLQLDAVRASMVLHIKVNDGV